MKQIILPKPPSVNHLYGITCRSGYARKYVTNKGNAWFEEAGLLLRSQYKKKHIKDKNISLYIKYYTIRGDIDNSLKALLDLLQKTETIKDDKQVMFLQIEKIIVHKRKLEGVEIEII